ncbi:MAG: Piwi domain-containing protein [Chitinophagaceae bacterium]
MAKQNLILNILNFSHPVQTVECSFQLAKANGFYPVKVSSLPVNIEDLFSKEELENIEYAYTNFIADEAISKPIAVDLDKSRRFAKLYYTHQLYNHFYTIADAIKTNFISDISLWFLDTKKINKDFDTYTVYTIKVQIARATKLPELVISYDGKSRVCKQSREQIHCDEEIFSSFLYNKRIYYKDNLPEDAGYHLDRQFPKINFYLSKFLGLQTTPDKPSNKYSAYFLEVSAFYDKYINTAEFKAVLPITSNGFITIDTDKIKQTTENSNLMQFGQNHTNIMPHYGLGVGGPYELSPHKNIKFIFLFHKEDNTFANTVFQWFEGKKDGFKGLKNYIKLNYSIDKANSIIFENKENPIEEIRQQLSDKTFADDVRYLAVYLSPISKAEIDEEKHKIYYQVKETLLDYRITSQVIDRDKINNSAFKYYLPNIAIAILAKLNGVPWRLQRNLSNELIVGVGAFKNAEIGSRYIGSAFCFSNNGHFRGFECHPAIDTFMLAGDIGKAVRKFKNDNADVKRLIIHFYKSMSKAELEPIEKELDELNLDIPIIIVSINKTESKDFVVFDTNSTHTMPISGTFIKTGWNEYLLCNNTRYGLSATEKIESYPFPIKLKLKATDETILDDSKTTKAIVDQVYQFSRMYWKSVKQQNIPVTILYPEMVAEIFPHFDIQELKQFGKDNLWFL